MDNHAFKVHAILLHPSRVQKAEACFDRLSLNGRKEIEVSLGNVDVIQLLQGLDHWAGEAFGRLGGSVADGLVRLKPKVSLPGGPSIQLG